MNDIFSPFLNFIIAYIDDVLVFFTSIAQHFKQLIVFFNVIIENGLVLNIEVNSRLEISNQLFKIHLNAFEPKQQCHQTKNGISELTELTESSYGL